MRQAGKVSMFRKSDFCSTKFTPQVHSDHSSDSGPTVPVPDNWLVLEATHFPMHPDKDGRSQGDTGRRHREDEAGV